MTAVTTELLLYAYKNGMFPMAESRDAKEVEWCFPKKRGVLPLDNFHVPRKLKKLFSHYPFDITIDKAFAEVIHACAVPREGRQDSWINESIEQAYNELFRLGYAHSVECWSGHTLVGGLYGVSLGGVFFGESMFSNVSNASKIALVALVIILQQGGYTLLDTQFINRHLQQFGAKEIASEVYMTLLKKALSLQTTFTLPADWNLFFHSGGDGI